MDKGELKGTKTIFESRTFYGVIITVAATVAGLFGYQIDQALTTDITSAVCAGAAVVGSLISLYGRVLAVRKIKR